MAKKKDRIRDGVEEPDVTEEDEEILDGIWDNIDDLPEIEEVANSEEVSPFVQFEKAMNLGRGEGDTNGGEERD